MYCLLRRRLRAANRRAHLINDMISQQFSTQNSVCLILKKIKLINLNFKKLRFKNIDVTASNEHRLLERRTTFNARTTSCTGRIGRTTQSLPPAAVRVGVDFQN